MAPRMSRLVVALAATIVVAWPPMIVQATKMESFLYGGPQAYAEGDIIALKVNKLTSTRTLLPIDPYQSKIGLCEPPGGPIMAAENLGEFLQGDRIQNSPYVIAMKQDMYCEPLCVTRDLGPGGSNNAMAKAIRNEYHQNWLLDGLPAASKSENECYVVSRYWQGVPLGWQIAANSALSSFEHFQQNCESGHTKDVVDPEVVLYNHVNMEIHYRELSKNRYAITRFLVEPFSIHHNFTVVDGEAFSKPSITTPIPSCRGQRQHTSYDMLSGLAVQNQTGPVVFTYDVTWVRDQDIRWSNRWDIYLSMDHAVPDQVHLMSIANTLIILLICVGILCCVWRRNISGYTRVGVDEHPPPEQPWHLVKNDVFRSPDMPLALAVACGTGAQLVATGFLVTLLAMSGLANQSHAGALTTATVILYTCSGIGNGYVAVFYYRIFQGKRSWKTVSLVSASAFPALGMSVFLGLQPIFKAGHSTYAVPMLTIVVVFFLWGFVSLPLATLGGWVARRRAPLRLPTKVNETIRNVPGLSLQDCLWVGLFVVFCGPYPFGSLFVEAYFILSSAWMGYYYNNFLYLAMVLLVTGITCAATAILFVFYFVFRKQNHYWWWKAYIFGCITGLCSMLYSLLYFRTLRTVGTAAAWTFFGEMFLLSVALSAALGFVALSAALWFSRRLFGVFEDESLDDHVEMSDVAVEQAVAVPPPPSTDSERANTDEVVEPPQIA